MAPTGNGSSLSSMINSGAPALKILCNGILLMLLVRQRALMHSKEHLIMIYTSFYDCFDGGTHFCASVFYYKVQTRLECLLKFRHFWYVSFAQAAVAMPMMISIDRILSVAVPFWYYKQTYKLGHKLGLVPMAWGILFAPYLIASAMYESSELIPHCFTTLTFKAYKAVVVEFMIRRVILIASVIMYGAVILIYTYKRIAAMKKVANATRDAQDREYSRFKQRQKKMTTTLGISAMATLLGYVVPLTLFDVVRIHFPHLQQFGWLLWIPINLSSMANMFIFLRQKGVHGVQGQAGVHGVLLVQGVRQAFTAFFWCKRMPERLQDWDTSVTNRDASRGAANQGQSAAG